MPEVNAFCGTWRPLMRFPAAAVRNKTAVKNDVRVISLLA